MEDSITESEATPSHLLSMQVQIGDGRKDILIINEQDDPYNLARNFAFKHSIDSVLESHLVTLIQLHKTQKLEQLQAEYIKSQIQANRVAMRKSPRKKTTLQRLAKSIKRVPKPTKPIKTMTNINAKLYKKNFGVSLYQKDLRWKQNQQKKLEEIKEKQLQNLRVSTLTFKPLISEYSNLLASYRYQSTQNHLLKLGEERNKRIEELQQEGVKKQMAECSFQPNPHRRQNLSCSNKLSATLHQDASERKQRRVVQSQAEFESNFHFQPNFQFKKIKQSAKQQEALANRLINYKKQKQEKIEKERKEQQQSEMFNNGNPLFVPQIFSVRTPHSKVHSKLFYSPKKHRENPSICSKKPQVNGNSNRIYEQLKGRQYAKIFNILDSDSDGLISSGHINIDSLDLKLLTVLTPLFKELDEGTEMDLCGFVQFIESMWESLSVDERTLIIKRESKSVDYSNSCSNLVRQKSTSLAMRKRENSRSTVYERAVNSKMITELKRQKQRELLEVESHKQCTFKPNLTKKLQSQQLMDFKKSFTIKITAQIIFYKRIHQ